MYERIDLDKAISVFNTELQSKGYRNNFTLARNDPRLEDDVYGTLYHCLQSFVKHYHESGGKETTFRLFTYPYYKHDRDFIRCRFQVSLQDAVGFKIKHMEIEDGISGKTREFRVRDNAQIPGSKSLTGFFPKPKLWERIWKGKFRP